MNATKDISTLEDIKLMVDEFYGKIREDELLAAIFNHVIQDRWPEHLEKMYRFWQTVLLGEHRYYGSPFVPHANLPVSKIHFDRWLELFEEVVDSHFTGSVADKAKLQGNRMAIMFLSKIEFYQNNPKQPLL